MRKRGRVDGNQTEIVNTFRSMGATVAILSTVGSGVPDLLVGYARRNILVECKVKSGVLTEAQVEFLQRWKGEAVIIRSTEEAQRLIERLAAERRDRIARKLLDI
jgi:Holliday junction resolvase